MYNIKGQSQDISQMWCHFSDKILENTKNSRNQPSATVVEVNGDDCVDCHNKKGDTGKDHSLWRISITSKTAIITSITFKTLNGKV